MKITFKEDKTATLPEDRKAILTIEGQNDLILSALGEDQQASMFINIDGHFRISGLLALRFNYSKYKLIRLYRAIKSMWHYV